MKSDTNSRLIHQLILVIVENPGVESGLDSGSQGMRVQGDRFRLVY